MEKIIKEAVETYQCPGCTFGSDIKCYEKHPHGSSYLKHSPGTTYLPGIGKVFLGMPKGFNRIGKIFADENNSRILIYETFQEYAGYNKWNIPNWKYLNESGHTLVRFLSPRTNYTGIHIFLENCMDKINCFEVDQEMIDKMD